MKAIKKSFLNVFLISAVLLTSTHCVLSQNPKSRLIVLTDVENEPDDNESLVRLVLYSNEIDIEGIVATTSTHMRDRVAPETIHKVIDAYEAVLPNLRVHAKGWPDAQTLRSKVTCGPVAYGMQGVGDGCDNAGSDAIITALESDDPRPLWVTAWGGVNTLAQALYKIDKTKSKKEAKRLRSKLRVYTISDQDDSGAWIRASYPDIYYIVSPGGYGNATWSGMMAVDDGADNEKISNSWIAANIQQGHGPLGACYPDVAYGIEGDTPSWLMLIPNGLNNPEHPDWGGWGGRYNLYIPDYKDLDLDGFTGGVPIMPETRPIWTNAIDSVYKYTPAEYGKSIVRSDKKYGGYRATVWRWRPEVQNDFAARLDWSITPEYKDANHAPVVVLKHPSTITAHSGEWVRMDASDSYDPDGDSLSYLWINYPEVGTLPTYTEIAGAENIHAVSVQLPQVSKPEILHYIVKVTDKGSPAMSSYARIIINVLP